MRPVREANTNVWSRLQANMKTGLRIDRDGVRTGPVANESGIRSLALSIRNCRPSTPLPLEPGFARLGGPVDFFCKQVNSD